MPTLLTAADHAAIGSIDLSLEQARNAADGNAFGAAFATDADFVNVRAEHHRGRPAIAAGHDAILQTMYARSRNHYRATSARALRADVALVHVESHLDASSGLLAGRHRALFPMVLLRADGTTWEIMSFHSTLAPVDSQS